MFLISVLAIIVRLFFLSLLQSSPAPQQFLNPETALILYLSGLPEMGFGSVYGFINPELNILFLFGWGGVPEVILHKLLIFELLN